MKRSVQELQAALSEAGWCEDTEELEQQLEDALLEEAVHLEMSHLAAQAEMYGTQER